MLALATFTTRCRRQHRRPAADESARHKSRQHHEHNQWQMMRQAMAGVGVDFLFAVKHGEDQAEV